MSENKIVLIWLVLTSLIDLVLSTLIRMPMTESPHLFDAPQRGTSCRANKKPKEGIRYWYRNWDMGY